VDVTFSGGSRLEELRHRARDAAAMYGPGAHRGLGHQGLHGDGEHHGLGLKELSPPVRAVEVDTDDGARIHITPLNAADAVAVRAEVHARVTRTRMGDCP
jgi:hypothetical protein